MRVVKLEDIDGKKVATAYADVADEVQVNVTDDDGAIVFNDDGSPKLKTRKSQVGDFFPVEDGWRQAPEDVQVGFIFTGRGWKEPEETAEEAERRFVAVRSTRDMLLAASDWTQIPDAPLDDKSRESWRKYRQQLRDLPSKLKDPRDVKWPEPPKSGAAK